VPYFVVKKAEQHKITGTQVTGAFSLEQKQQRGKKKKTNKRRDLHRQAPQQRPIPSPRVAAPAPPPGCPAPLLRSWAAVRPPTASFRAARRIGDPGDPRPELTRLPLADLSPDNVELVDAFNAHPEQARLVILLSPT